jgi:hypothetical protein
MIKITYTAHIYADFHTRSCAKICHPSIHLSNKTPIKMTLSNYLSKKMWVIKKKKKRKHAQKHGLEFCKPTSQISKKRESYMKRVHA